MLKVRTRCGKKQTYAQTLLYKLFHKREIFTVGFVILGLRPLGFVMYFTTYWTELFVCW